MSTKKKVTIARIATALTNSLEAGLILETGLSLGEDFDLVKSIMFDIVQFVAAHRRKIQNGGKN